MPFKGAVSAQNGERFWKGLGWGDSEKRVGVENRDNSIIQVFIFSPRIPDFLMALPPMVKKLRFSQAKAQPVCP